MTITNSIEISLLVVLGGLLSDFLAIKRATEFDKCFVAGKWSVIVVIVYALGEFADVLHLLRFLAMLTAISSALTHVALPAIKQAQVDRRAR